MFAYLYPWVTINFTNLGDESQTVPASNNGLAAYSIGAGGTYPGVGDFRFGMHNIDGSSSTLAPAYEPGGTVGVWGNVGADCHFDSSEEWRLDSSAAGSEFSIKYTTVHELGHSFALGHNSDAYSIMNASISRYDIYDTNFPDGLSGSIVDRQCIMARYS